MRGARICRCAESASRRAPRMVCCRRFFSPGPYPVQPLIGILLKIFSAFAFTMMAATIKLVSDSFPVGQLIFFRSAFAL